MYWRALPPTICLVAEDRRSNRSVFNSIVHGPDTPGRQPDCRQTALTIGRAGDVSTGPDWFNQIATSVDAVWLFSRVTLFPGHSHVPTSSGTGQLPFVSPLPFSPAFCTWPADHEAICLISRNRETSSLRCWMASFSFLATVSARMVWGVFFCLCLRRVSLKALSGFAPWLAP